MTKEKLWELFCSKNSQLTEDSCTFTRAGVRKFFDTTFDAAVAAERSGELDEDNDEYIPPSAEAKRSFNELFNGLLGGFR